MKKGFTLVELLAVILILGIIFGLAIPKVMTIMNNKKDELYQDTKKEIERLAASYVADHPNLLRQDTFTITVDDLCTNNYIECPVIDPRDRSEMEGTITVSYQSNKYEYNYADD